MRGPHWKLDANPRRIAEDWAARRRLIGLEERQAQPGRDLVEGLAVFAMLMGVLVVLMVFG